jgi:hypothetical protein
MARAVGWFNRRALAEVSGVGAVLAVAVCLAVGVSVFGERGVLISVEGNPMGTIPSISSACIKGNKACIVAVPGGSLRLTDIRFPAGPDAPGKADAVGYVNGRFVAGSIQLSTQRVHPVDQEGHEPDGVKQGGLTAPEAKVKRAWPNGPGVVQLRQHPVKHRQMEAQKARARVHRGRQLRPVTSTQQLAGGAPDHEAAAEEQYKAALAAVEGHMHERMEHVEEEATKIAEAVTKVITSPAVSKKIADMAMDAAAAKAGPAAEASLTGGVQEGVEGEGQFGYSNEPAGTEGPGCGAGCAGMAATTPDLDTVATGVPASAPASSAFYAAWKAMGAPTGTVQAVGTQIHAPAAVASWWGLGTRDAAQDASPQETDAAADGGEDAAQASVPVGLRQVQVGGERRTALAQRPASLPQTGSAMIAQMQVCVCVCVCVCARARGNACVTHTRI